MQTVQDGTETLQRFLQPARHVEPRHSLNQIVEILLCNWALSELQNDIVISCRLRETYRVSISGRFNVVDQLIERWRMKGHSRL